MHIEHLRSFLEATASGSFLEAAVHLNVSQSTVSARIKALEERVGGELFVRKKTGVELNDAGRRFHRYALTVVRAWDQGRRAANPRSKSAPIISVGVQESVWALIASKWTTEMRRLMPSAKMRLVSDVSRELIDHICDGLLDVAVTWEPRRRRDLEVEHLVDVPLILVSSKPHEWAGALPPNYVYIEWGEEFRAKHDLAFDQQGLPDIAAGFASNGLDVILDRGGAGYFMEPAVEKVIRQNRLHRVAGSPKFTRSIYVVFPTAPLDRALLEVALTSLRSVCARLTRS